MKRIFLATAFLVFIACNNKTEKKVSLPPPPASREAVAQLIKQKKYVTQKVATVSSFEMDKENPYQWMDETEDTTAFLKKYLEERMNFSLEFVNDTSVVMIDEGKTITGTYKTDNETGDEEKQGIKIRVSYPDDNMSFPGMSGPMMMTMSYFVAGADDKTLLLETTRSYNNRKVAILMQAQ